MPDCKAVPSLGIQDVDIAPETLQALYGTMLLIRRFEEKIIEVYPEQDMKSPVHLCIGEEAIAAGVCANLHREDYAFSTHRSHGHCLAKGAEPKRLYAEFYGRVTGCCRGKGGSMHPAFPEIGILGTSAIVGGGIPLAVGTALASKLRNDGRVSVTFFGDGAVDEGAFHESMNFASLKKLPVIFVCENNFYAVNSPLSARQPHLDIHKRAESYGMPGAEVAGDDVLSIYREAKKAVQLAREGGGPTLIECKTYRWRGHVGPECDYQKGCRPKDELENWMAKCPVGDLKNMLIEKGFVSEDWCRSLLRDTDALLDKALEFGKGSPFPKRSEVLEHVYWEKK
jgi:acetoin:2,6-dichlorophenolindophenol oxidoreductase subunit alpha